MRQTKRYRDSRTDRTVYPDWRRHAGSLAAAAVIAGVLSACAAHAPVDSRASWDPASRAGIQQPPPSLMRAQAAPDCRWRPERSAGGPAPQSEAARDGDSIDNQRAIIRQLEYERACYRQYEIQARHRLTELQASLGRTPAHVRRQTASR